MKYELMFLVVLVSGCIHSAEPRTVLPSAEQCKPISFCTYNFGALTPKVEPENYRPRFQYIADWPGVIIDNGIRDQGGLGYVVPGFATKQSGAGIWWYWMMRRGNGFRGFDPEGSVTLKELALSYAGSTNENTSAVQNYFRGYVSHAEIYFGRAVGLEEPILLSDPDNVWNIARTMFHHEAGMRVTDKYLTRRQFEDGIALAQSILAGG